MDNLEYLKKQTQILINLYNAKRYEEVILKGKVLIKKFPNQLLFYNATSLSLSATGKNEEALKILSRALSQQNNNIHPPIPITTTKIITNTTTFTFSISVIL